MEFSVSIEGLDKIQGNTQAIQQAVTQELNAGLYASVQKVATDYKKSILSGGKSGRVYTRRGISHQASAPGEAPASDTGGLVNSVTVALDSALSSVMRVAKKYAMALEFGTIHIAPRPAALPALESNRGWIINRLTQALQRAMQRKS